MRIWLTGIFLTVSVSVFLLGGNTLSNGATPSPAAQAKRAKTTEGIDWNDPAAVAALRQVLSRDALSRVRRYALSHRMGFRSRDLTHWIAGIYFAREGGRDVAWVVAASKPRRNFECHACYPKLSILVYAQAAPNRWQLTGQGYETFESSYGWGNAPDEKNMALVHIAPDKVALAVRSSFFNMGWEEDYYALYRVERDRGHQILFTQIHTDNKAADSKPFTDWSTELRLRPSKESPWCEIYLKRRGIDEGRPMDQTVVYRYSNGSYRPIGDDPVMKWRR
ncbi:hypothetical protein [Nitratifractor salsuginis]|uniref:Uncharacterized protein n=1 Tax=Nitratifractor salsuginis (strain DSM 16511 / JCM 12458 / E9I37-1) TaxID=749222 RepID=E6X311_NITSE|nr:hypothetical protein [Nitratifractor salsuginis]ADV46155.1 hypothetical protein Nitsa_0895 [Nitratifractor salsuginis DSM 16511]